MRYRICPETVGKTEVSRQSDSHIVSKDVYTHFE